MYYNNDNKMISAECEDFVSALQLAGWELVPSSCRHRFFKKACVKIRVLSVPYFTQKPQCAIFVRSSRGGYALIKDLEHKVNSSQQEFLDYAETLVANPSPIINRGSKKKTLPQAQDFVEDATITGTTLNTRHVCYSYKFDGVVTINESGQIEDALKPDSESWVSITAKTVTTGGHCSATRFITNQKQWYQIRDIWYGSKKGKILRIIKTQRVLTHHDLALITQLVEHCTT